MIAPFGFLLGLFADFGLVFATTHDAFRRSVALNEVNVGVLLPTVNVDGKLFDQPVRAVRMAIDEINKNPSILSNTQVRVVVNSTGYDRWQALEAALWQVNIAKVISIVGGADASEVKIISPIVKEGEVPLIFPSTVEYDRDLDSETLYPTVFRIGPPDDRLGLAVTEIVEHFSWRKLAVIHSDDDYGVNGVRYAVDTARTLGYNDIRSVYLKEPRGPHLAESESQTIRRLKDDDFRIFIVVLHPGEQAEVLRVASEAGMFEEGYAWVITHCNYGTDLFVPGKMDGIICIRQQINETVTKEVYERMQKSEYRGEESSLWLDSVYAYNAANDIAQALDAVLLSENEELVNDKPSGSPDYRPTPTTVGKELLKVLRTKSLTNRTGSFNFQRTSTDVKYEYLNYHNGQFVLFATYDHQEFSLVDADSDTQFVHFPGNQTVVPLDTPSNHSKSLRVLVPVSYPFTDYVDKMTRETCVHRQDHTNCEFIGVAIRLIKHITSQIGLGVNFTLWTGSWNDLVKQVGNESSQWDIASASVTVTSLRSQHATFSSSIYDSGLRILTLRPPVEGKGYFEFLKPFSLPVWLLIVFTLLLAATVMLYLAPEAIEEKDTSPMQESQNDKSLVHTNPGATSPMRESQNDKSSVQTVKPVAPTQSNHGKKIFKFVDAVYFSCCVFFAVHSMDKIKHLYSRFFVVVLCFWVLIMVSAYTANMAAFLTHRQATQHIHDYKDLPNVPVGCRFGTLNWDYVKNELALRQVINVTGGHHAVQLLKSGEIKAYIADTPHVLGLAATDCDVVVVGSQEQHQKYAFPMKPSLPYHNQINKAILDAVEKEFVTDTLDEMLDNQCPSLWHQDTIRSITLQDIGGLFMLAAAAGFLALLVARALLLKSGRTQARTCPTAD